MWVLKSAFVGGARHWNRQVMRCTDWDAIAVACLIRVSLCPNTSSDGPKHEKYFVNLRDPAAETAQNIYHELDMKNYL